MPWKADQVYTKPNPELIAYLQSLEGFSFELFLVNDLEGINTEWARSFMLSDQPNENSFRKHSLPKDGLLVIKPAETGKAIYEHDWDFADAIVPTEMELNPGLTENQLKLMALLESLHKKFNFPFLYYHCLMWGGLVEREYAIVFDERIRVYTYDCDTKKELELTDYGPIELETTVLQRSFLHLDLALPTWYFVLHDSFDWKRYRVIK